MPWSHLVQNPHDSENYHDILTHNSKIVTQYQKLNKLSQLWISNVCLLNKFRKSIDVEKDDKQAKFIQMSILGAPLPYEDEDIITCVPSEDTLNKEL